LNLESLYWLSNDLISSVGSLAPNLIELSIRSMPEVSNMAFKTIFEHMHQLQIVDFSNSTNLHTSAMQLLIRRNPSLTDIQASGCNLAIDDTSIRLISGLKGLTFLDISFCKKVTDQGFIHFQDKKLNIVTLVISGCSRVTNNGINAILSSCTDTLADFEAAYLDGEELKHDYL